MYKLVIVEDERDVRNRLAALVEKSGCSFKTVAEYENGIDAYDGIISENPDLILTDIRIPYINGIELSRMVRDIYPMARIIIITGYNEFDYAKEAANLGVIGFISKPITLENIRDLLGKAEASLDEEFLTDANLSRLSAFYRENLPVIRENDLYRLSNMSEVTPAFEAKLKSYGIGLDYPYMIVCMFDFDSVDEGETGRGDIVFTSIRRYAAEFFANVCDTDFFSHNDKLCLILKYRTKPYINELEMLVERMIHRAGRYSDMPVSAGISGIYKNSRNFSLMAGEASRALEYRSVMGGQKVFLSGNAGAAAVKTAAGDNLIKELGYMLRSRNAEDCIAMIGAVRKQISGSRNSLYYSAAGILNVLITGCDDPDGLYAKCGGPDIIYRKLFEIKTDDGIFDYLQGLARLICGINDGVIAGSLERSLRSVISYMEAHYCDPDISFESLAREVNFSVSYISALLKKRRGTSFIKMLTELRMEKAKELLADPSLKIIDIAEQLGYNDSYYFSHCFKKYVGVPPKEYRTGVRSP